MLIYRERALVIRSARPRTAFIEFVWFSYLAVDFLVNPWESIPSTCFLVGVNLALPC